MKRVSGKPVDLAAHTINYMSLQISVLRYSVFCVLRITINKLFDTILYHDNSNEVVMAGYNWHITIPILVSVSALFWWYRTRIGNAINARYQPIL